MKPISSTLSIRITLVFLCLLMPAPALAQTANTGALTGAVSATSAGRGPGQGDQRSDGKARTVVSQSNWLLTCRWSRATTRRSSRSRTRD